MKMVVRLNQRTLTKGGNMSEEIFVPPKGYSFIKSEEELEAFKKKERIFNHFFTPEEQRTILGLLEGRKRRKEKEAKNREREVS